MKHFKLYIMFLLLISSVYAQDLNKIITDEKSEKPMLIGYTTREAFKDTSFSWWFDSEYEIYEPDTVHTAQLKGKMDNVTIKVAMGTWCSDSRREIPHFLKITDVIGYPSDKITFISVTSEKSAEIKKVTGETEEFKVDLVPTIFFYRNNEEIGRIEEMPAETLEQDMLKIVSK